MKKEKYIYVITSLSYLTIISLLYLISFNYTITSPSGIPNPLSYPYSNNDFHFYREFALHLPDSISREYKPGLIFPFLIYFFEKIINYPELLSPFFSLIGLIYVIRLTKIFSNCFNVFSNYTFVFYLFCPYLYFFIIYPSTDFILCIIFAEVLYLVYKNNNLNNSFKSIIMLSILAVMARPNGMAVIFIFIFFESYNLFNEKIKKKILIQIKDFSLLTILFIMLFFSFLYYFDYKNVYFDSSEIYISERFSLSQYSYIYDIYNNSPLDKFFSSLGLRQSFETTAPNFYKNYLFVYIRLILSFILLLSFIILIFNLKYKISKVIFVGYISLLIPAYNGVSFERYFIPVYPFILQIGLSYFLLKLKKYEI